LKDSNRFAVFVRVVSRCAQLGTPLRLILAPAESRSNYMVPAPVEAITTSDLRRRGVNMYRDGSH
jgi:hypothetical protein